MGPGASGPTGQRLERRGRIDPAVRAESEGSAVGDHPLQSALGDAGQPGIDAESGGVEGGEHRTEQRARHRFPQIGDDLKGLLHLLETFSHDAAVRIRAARAARLTAMFVPSNSALR